MDEFERIARLFRPLTEGAPEAFGLLDDAAAIPSRPGFDLIVTKDAVVEGVHFLSSDPPDLVARKLLRANLSDLAAKGAEPFAYFLAVAWPFHWDETARAAFAGGLREDQHLYRLKLFGGDTTSTPGPLTASVTALGWSPAGGMVRRAGAAPGDRLLVSGTIGDATLGLEVARGGLAGLPAAASAQLLGRYRLPEPRLDRRAALRSAASAAADVSDGLVADTGHIATASKIAVEIDLGRMPLSPAAAAWLATTDRTEGLTRLATGGDDYEIVCTAPPDRAAALVAAGFTEIGEIRQGQGVRCRLDGREVRVDRPGWRHD